jgi:hypothetical protein
MAGHSPSKTGVNALVSRPSRSGSHYAHLSGITGTSPVMTGGGRSALPYQFTIQTANAPPPCFFAAPGTPSVGWRVRPPGKSTEGARDARDPDAPMVLGPTGPRRLATSRLVEVLMCACALRKARRKSAKPKASRARCCEVCSAKSPVVDPFVTLNPCCQGPRLSTVGALATQPAMLLTARRLTSRQRGPQRAAARRDQRGLDRRVGKLAPHLRRPNPGHRSPPRVWRR